MRGLGDDGNIAVQIPLKHNLCRRAVPACRNLSHSRTFEEEGELDRSVGRVHVAKGRIGGYVDAVFGVLGDEVGGIQIGVAFELMRVGNDEAGGRLDEGFELGRGEVAHADVADGAAGEEEGHCAPGL